MADTISFSGLASGLDTKAIIEALVGVRQKPMLLLEKRKASFQDVKKQYEALRTRLKTLSSAADELRKASGVQAYAATSSNESVLKATAGGSAQATSVTLTVNALAKTEVEASQGFADFDVTGAGSGTLDVTVGGTLHQVTILAGQDSLEDVRDAINAADIGVSATIVNEGTGASPYRLVLTAEDSGAEATIEVDASGLTGGAQALAFSEVQAGANASVTVNGITVERASNSIDDVVEGVTFTLNATGTSTVTIQPDVTKMREKVEAYVKAHNDLMTFVNGQLKVDATTKTAGPLSGELLVRNLKTRLLGLHALSGYPGGSFANLSQVGIELGSDGSITFDGAAFDKAVDQDFDGVVTLFSQPEAILDGDFFQLGNVPDGIASGTHDVVVTQAAAKASTTAGGAFTTLAQDETLTFTQGAKVSQVQLAAGDDLAAVLQKINSQLTKDGLDLAAKDDNGTLEFVADDYGAAGSFSVASDQASGGTGVGTVALNAAGLDVAGTIGGVAATGDGRTLNGTGAFEDVTLTYTGTAPGSATLTFQAQGFFARAHELLDAAAKPVTGSIDERLDALNDTISDIDDRIESQEERLEQYREHLERKFAALESILGGLQAQQASLAALSTQLFGSNG